MHTGSSMYGEGHILPLQLGKIQLFCFERDEKITGIDKSIITCD